MTQADNIKMNTQWFKDRLADKRLSIRGLCKMLGIDPAAGSLMLRGLRKMTSHEAHQISVILAVPLNEVLRQAGIDVSEDIKKSPIAAHMDQEGKVTAMPPGTHALEQGPADLPVGSYAVQVRSPNSIKDGWLLFVTPAQVPPAQCLDSLCVVATNSGQHLMGIVRRGYRKSTYNVVLWPSGQMQTDVDLAWASKVLWLKPA